MSDIKKFYDKRVIHDFNELLPDVGDWGIFCLPVVAVKIARKYWSMPAFWMTSYSKAVLSDREYLAPNEEELQGIFEMLDEALGSSEMAFCSDIIGALVDIKSEISGLKLSCNCGGGSGCCGGGGNTETIIPPTAESISEGVPPDGMEIIPVGDSNRCHAINYLIDYTAAAVHDLVTFGAAQAIQTGVSILITILGVVASKNPLMSWQLYKVIGYIEGIALFFGQEIDLEKMDNILNDTDVKKILVCAWLETEEYDVIGGNDAMADILTGEGFTTPELGLLSAICGVVAWSCIWYQETGAYSIYKDMQDYEGGVGCDDCAIGNIIAGYPGGLVEDYGVIEQAAVFVAGWGCGELARELGIQFSRAVNVTDIDFISGGITPCSPSFLGYTLRLDGEEIYNSDEMPTLPIACDAIYLLSGSDFTADITITEVV